MKTMDKGRRVGSAANLVSTQFPLGRIASACALLVLFSAQAGAQQADGNTTTQTTQATPAQQQTAVVTGIRHSLEDSLSVKRNSDSIVEVVSEEDTGKL